MFDLGGARCGAGIALGPPPAAHGSNGTVDQPQPANRGLGCLIEVAQTLASR